MKHSLKNLESEKPPLIVKQFTFWTCTRLHSEVAGELIKQNIAFLMDTLSQETLAYNVPNHFWILSLRAPYLYRKYWIISLSSE